MPHGISWLFPFNSGNGGLTTFPFNIDIDLDHEARKIVTGW